MKDVPTLIPKILATLLLSSTATVNALVTNLHVSKIDLQALTVSWDSVGRTDVDHRADPNYEYRVTITPMGNDKYAPDLLAAPIADEWRTVEDMLVQTNDNCVCQGKCTSRAPDRCFYYSYAQNSLDDVETTEKLYFTYSGKQVTEQTQYKFQVEQRRIGSAEVEVDDLRQFTFPPKMYINARGDKEVMIEWTPTYTDLYKYKVKHSKEGQPVDTEGALISKTDENMLQGADSQSETSIGLFHLTPNSKYAVLIVPDGLAFDPERSLDLDYAASFNSDNYYYFTTHTTDEELLIERLDTVEDDQPNGRTFNKERYKADLTFSPSPKLDLRRLSQGENVGVDGVTVIPPSGKKDFLDCTDEYITVKLVNFEGVQTYLNDHSDKKAFWQVGYQRSRFYHFKNEWPDGFWTEEKAVESRLAETCIKDSGCTGDIKGKRFIDQESNELVKGFIILSQVFELPADATELKYKTLTTLSENLPFTFSLFIYVVNSDNTVHSHMNVNSIQKSEPVQLFTRPSIPYGVSVPRETIEYNALTMEWNEVDNVLFQLTYNHKFNGPDPSRATDSFGFPRQVKKNNVFWAPDYRYNFDPNNIVELEGEPPYLYSYAHYLDPDYSYRYMESSDPASRQFIQKFWPNPPRADELPKKDMLLCPGFKDDTDAATYNNKIGDNFQVLECPDNDSDNDWDCFEIWEPSDKYECWGNREQFIDDISTEYQPKDDLGVAIGDPYRLEERLDNKLEFRFENLQQNSNWKFQVYARGLYSGLVQYNPGEEDRFTYPLGPLKAEVISHSHESQVVTFTAFEISRKYNFIWEWEEFDERTETWTKVDMYEKTASDTIVQSNERREISRSEVAALTAVCNANQCPEYDVEWKNQHCELATDYQRLKAGTQYRYKIWAEGVTSGYRSKQRQDYDPRCQYGTNVYSTEEVMVDDVAKKVNVGYAKTQKYTDRNFVQDFTVVESKTTSSTITLTWSQESDAVMRQVVYQIEVYEMNDDVDINAEITQDNNPPTGGILQDISNVNVENADNVKCTEDRVESLYIVSFDDEQYVSSAGRDPVVKIEGLKALTKYRFRIRQRNGKAKVTADDLKTTGYFEGYEDQYQFGGCETHGKWYQSKNVRTGAPAATIDSCTKQEEKRIAIEILAPVQQDDTYEYTCYVWSEGQELLKSNAIDKKTLFYDGRTEMTADFENVLKPYTSYSFICYTLGGSDISADDEGTPSAVYSCRTAPPKAVIYPFALTDINRIEISWQQDQMFDENINFKILWLHASNWQYEKDEEDQFVRNLDNKQFKVLEEDWTNLNTQNNREYLASSFQTFKDNYGQQEESHWQPTTYDNECSRIGACSEDIYIRNWYNDGNINSPKKYPSYLRPDTWDVDKIMGRPVLNHDESVVSLSATPYRFYVSTYHKSDPNAVSTSEPRDFWTKPAPIPILVQHWRKTQTTVPLIFSPAAEKSNIVNALNFEYEFQRRQYTPDSDCFSLNACGLNGNDNFNWETRLRFKSTQGTSTAGQIDFDSVEQVGGALDTITLYESADADRYTDKKSILQDWITQHRYDIGNANGLYSSYSEFRINEFQDRERWEDAVEQMMKDQLEIFTDNGDGRIYGNHYVIEHTESNIPAGAIQYQYRITVDHKQAGKTIIEDRHLIKSENLDDNISGAAVFDLITRDFWELKSNRQYALVQAWTLPQKPDFDVQNEGSNLVLRINKDSCDVKSKQYFYYRYKYEGGSFREWVSLLAQGYNRADFTLSGLDKDEEVVIEVAAALYYPKVIDDDLDEYNECYSDRTDRRKHNPYITDYIVKQQTKWLPPWTTCALRTTDTTSTSIGLSWNRYNSNYIYKVQYRRADYDCRGEVAAWTDLGDFTDSTVSTVENLKPSTYYEFRLQIFQEVSGLFATCEDEDQAYTDPAKPEIYFDNRATTSESLEVTCIPTTSERRSDEGTEVEHQRLYMRRGPKEDDPRDAEPLYGSRTVDDSFTWTTYSNYVVDGLLENTQYCFKCETKIDVDEMETRCTDARRRPADVPQSSQTAQFVEECTFTTPPKCVDDFRVVTETRTRTTLEVEWTVESNLQYQVQYRVYGSGNSFEPIGDRSEFKEYITSTARETKDRLDSAQHYEFRLMLRSDSFQEDHASCEVVEGYTVNNTPDCFVDVTQNGIRVTASKDPRDVTRQLYSLEYIRSSGSGIRETTDWQSSDRRDSYTWDLPLRDFDEDTAYDFKCCVRTDKVEPSFEFRNRIHDDQCKDTDIPPIPGCPFGMEVLHASKTTSSIRVDWNRQTDVTYRIEYRQWRGAGETELIWNSSPDERDPRLAEGPHDLRGLVSSTPYEMRLHLVNSRGFERICYFETAYTIPSKPRPQCIDRLATERRIRLDWYYDRYTNQVQTVSYKRDDADASDWVNYDFGRTVTPEINIEPLSPRTAYEFDIETVLDPRTESPYFEPRANTETDRNRNVYEDYDCSTRHDCDIAAFRISSTDQTTSTLAVEWRGFNDDADDVNYEYRLQYRHDREGQQLDEWSTSVLVNEQIDGNDQYNYIQRNLRPARAYDFQVQILDTFTQYSVDSCDYVTGCTLPSVPSLSAANRNNDRGDYIEVSCTKLQTDFEEQDYKIEYRKYYAREQDQVSWTSAFVGYSLTSTHELYGLDDNTEYEFKCINRIRTSKCNYESSVKIIRQTTHHSTDCPNFEVDINSRTQSSLTVKWNNDVDLDYKIQYRQCGSLDNYETITRVIDGRAVEWITENNVNSLQKTNLKSATCYEFTMMIRGLAGVILSANCRPYEITLPTKPTISCANAMQYSNSLSVQYSQSRLDTEAQEFLEVYYSSRSSAIDSNDWRLMEKDQFVSGRASISGLAPESVYYFYTTARVIKRGAFRSSYDTIVSDIISCQTNIDGVTDIRCINDLRQQRSLTVQWSTNGNDYQLQYRKYEFGEFRTSGSWYTYSAARETIQETISQLDPGHRYQFRLIKRRLQSQVTSNNIASCFTLPQKPVVVCDGMCGSSSCRIKWTDINDREYFAFDVRYRTHLGFQDEEREGWVQPIWTSQLSPYTIRGLVSDTSYDFQVKSRNTYNNDEIWSDTITCSTVHTGGCNFQVIPPKGEDFLTVQWQNNGFHYRIEYAQFQQNVQERDLNYREAHQGWLTDNQNTYKVTGLIPATQYFFKLHAMNPQNQFSVECQNIPFGFTLPSKPTISIDCESATSTCLTVSWSKGLRDTEAQDQILYYKSRVSGEEAQYTRRDSGVVVTTWGQYGNTQRVCFLSPATNYQFYVDTRIIRDTPSKAKSDWTGSCGWTRPECLLTPSVRSETKTQSQIELYWNERAADWGSYQLQYKVYSSVSWINWPASAQQGNNKALVNNLTPAQRYSFRLVLTDSRSSYTDECPAIDRYTLPTCNQIAITENARNSDTQITIVFDETDIDVEEQFFSVYYGEAGTTPVVQSFAPHTSPYTQNGIQASTNHCFRMQCCIRASPQDCHMSQQVCDMTPDPPPYNGIVIERECDSLKIRWEAIGTHNFYIQMYSDREMRNLVRTMTTTQQTLLVDGLNEATSYYFTIYGISTISSKQTKTSGMFSGTTLICKPELVEVMSTECHEEYTEFEVRCSKNDDASHYQIRWKADDFEDAFGDAFEGNWNAQQQSGFVPVSDFIERGHYVNDHLDQETGKTHVMYQFFVNKNIMPSTRYTVECRVMKGGEQSLWTRTTKSEGRYTMPQRPRNVIQNYSSQDRIGMQFEKVFGSDLHYEVWWKPTDSDQMFEQFRADNQNMFMFDENKVTQIQIDDQGLKACERYTLKVRALNPEPYHCDSVEVQMYTQCPCPRITVHNDRTECRDNLCISWDKVPGDQVQYSASARFHNYDVEQVKFSQGRWQEQDDVDRCFDEIYPETQYQLRVQVKRFDLPHHHDWTLSGGDCTPAFEWTPPCQPEPVVCIATTDVIQEINFNHKPLYGFGDYQYMLHYHRVDDDEVQESGWMRGSTFTDYLLNHDSLYEWKVKVRRTFIHDYDHQSHVYRDSVWSEATQCQTDRHPPVPQIIDIAPTDCDCEWDISYRFPRSTRYNSRIHYMSYSGDSIYTRDVNDWTFHNLQDETRTIKELLANRVYGFQVEVINRMSQLSSFSLEERRTTHLPHIPVFTFEVMDTTESTVPLVWEPSCDQDHIHYVVDQVKYDRAAAEAIEFNPLECAAHHRSFPEIRTHDIHIREFQGFPEACEDFRLYDYGYGLDSRQGDIYTWERNYASQDCENLQIKLQWTASCDGDDRDVQYQCTYEGYFSDRDLQGNQRVQTGLCCDSPIVNYLFESLDDHSNYELNQYRWVWDKVHDQNGECSLPRMRDPCEVSLYAAGCDYCQSNSDDPLCYSQCSDRYDALNCNYCNNNLWDRNCPNYDPNYCSNNDIDINCVNLREYQNWQSGRNGRRLMENRHTLQDNYDNHFFNKWYMDLSVMSWESITNNLLVQHGCELRSSLADCHGTKDIFRTYTVDDTKLLIEDLEHAQEYVFRVRATEDDIEFGHPTLAIFKTYFTQTSIHHAVAPDQHSITIEWQQVADANNYFVEYGEFDFDKDDQDQVFTVISEELDEEQLSFTAHNLQKSHKYAFHVIAKDIDGVESVSVSNIHSHYTQPYPTTATQTASTPSEIHIMAAKNPADMGQHVNLRAYFVHGQNHVNAADRTEQTPAQEIHYTEAASCSHYEMWIQTVNPTNMQEPSQGITDEELQAMRVMGPFDVFSQCERPMSVQAHAVDHQSVKVSWLAIPNPQNHLIRYAIHYRAAGSTAEWQFAHENTALEHVVAGLSAEKLYEFYVVAHVDLDADNAFYTSAASDSVTEWTMIQQLAPVAFQASEATDIHLHAQWQHTSIGPQVEYVYTLTYEQNEGKQQHRQTQQLSQKEFLCMNLYAEVEYEFQVMVHRTFQYVGQTVKLHSHYSVPSVATTLELPSQPIFEGIQDMDIYADNVEISWREVSDAPDLQQEYAYRVIVQQEENGPVSGQSYTDGYSQVVENLQPSTYYYFTVEAHNLKSGKSSRSATYPEYTLPVAPGGIALVAHSQHTVTVGWEAVRGHTYSVHLSKADGSDSRSEDAGSNSKYTFEALQSETQYTVTVRATDNETQRTSRDSESLVVFTNPLAPAVSLSYATAVSAFFELAEPSFTSQFDVLPSETNYVLIDMRDLNGEFQNVNFANIVDDFDGSEQMQVALPERKTQYQFRFRFQNKRSGFTSEFSSTLNVNSGVEPVSTVSLDKITDTTAEISWSAPEWWTNPQQRSNDYNIYYTVRYTTPGERKVVEEKLEDRGQSSFNHGFTGLQALRDYTFEVQVTLVQDGQNYHSAFQAVQSTTTPTAQLQINGLEVAGQSFDSVQLVWDNTVLFNEDTTFVVECKEEGAEYWMVADENDTLLRLDGAQFQGDFDTALGARTAWKVTGLKSATHYHFRVHAHNGNRRGTDQAIQAYTAPAPVHAVTVRKVATNYVYLEWQLERDLYHDQITWFVQHIRDDTNEKTTVNLGQGVRDRALVDGLHAGAEYVFYVYSTTEDIEQGLGGNSRMSDRAVATTRAADDRLAAPAGEVILTQTAMEGHIELRWTDVTPEGCLFKLESRRYDDEDGDWLEHPLTLDTSETVEPAEIGISYDFRVTAFNELDDTIESDEVRSHAIRQRPKRARLPRRAQNIIRTATSVALKWPEIAGAVKYNLRFRKVQESSRRRLSEDEWQTVEGVSNDYQLTGLDEGSQYEVQVAGVNEDGVQGDWSNSMSVETETASTPGIVRNLQVTSKTSHEISLNWLAAEHATKYHVCRTSEGVEKCQVTDLTTFTITDLEPSHSYLITVAGSNDGSERGQTTSITESTNKADESIAVQVPANLRVGKNGATSIEISYSKVENARYRVHLYDPSTDSHVSDIVDELTYRFTGLKVDHGYQVAVSAIVDGDESVRSTFIATKTLAQQAPFKPTSVQAGTSTLDSVSVSLTAPRDVGGSGLLAYTVYYRAKGATEWQAKTKQNPTDTDTVLIDGLKAGTEYEIQASASNLLSESARTSTITADTLKEEPSGTSDEGTTAAIVIVVVIIVLVVAIAATVTICVCKDKKDSKNTDRSANYREAANTERALTDNQQTHQTKPISPREEPRRVQEAPVSAPVPQQQPARQQQPVSPRGGAISNGIEVEQNNQDLEMVPRRQAAEKPTRTVAPEQVEMQFENQNPPELMTSPRQQQQTPVVTATTDGNYIEKMAQGMKQRISIARRDPTSQQKRRDDLDDDQPEGESSMN